MFLGRGVEVYLVRQKYLAKHGGEGCHI